MTSKYNKLLVSFFFFVLTSTLQATGVTTDTPPTATEVTVTGTAQEGQTLTASYTYADVDDDDENGTTFQWYRLFDDGVESVGRFVDKDSRFIKSASVSVASIAGATSKTYTVTAEDVGATLYFTVKPVNAKGTGDDVTSTRSEVVVARPASGAATPAAPTPKELVESFVGRLYEHILSRVADKAGTDYWTSDLTTKGLSAYEVVVNFFESTEYLAEETSSGSFVDDIYVSILDRKVDAAGYHYWVTQLKNGLSREEVLDALLRSKEFEKLSADYGVKTFPEE